LEGEDLDDALRENLLKEIVWPSNEPLMFERRRGGTITDIEEQYAIAHSEENIRKIAALGVRLLPADGGGVHFYKGFGFEIEKEEMQNTKKLVELCHKYGIKVSVYIGGTLFAETLFLENPKAREWAQIDQDGKPITYSGHQTNRYFPCYNNEEYLGYIKEIVRYAIKEIGADRIFFDNPGIGRPEPQSCHCPKCVKKFKDFLRNKYDEETLRKRFGFTRLDLISPPTWNIFNQPWDLITIDDPLKQEWIDFRCHSKAEFFREIYKYIKSLNPSIPVAINIKGIYGRNRAFIEAIDHSRFSGACDCMIMDSGVYAHMTEDGALISEIRSFKVARILNMTVASPPCRGAGKVEWAVAMAFNKPLMIPGFGYEGGPYGPKDIETLHYYDFYLKHEDLYTNAESIAEVAILRSFTSMAYNNFSTHLSTILFEQTLIQAKIPFDIIFDQQIENLPRYSVLVLANQESLSDEQIRRIREFVFNGGGLVATDATSLYDEWRRRRRCFGLADLFGFEKIEDAHKNMNFYGKGRVVYIPRIEPAEQIPLKKDEEQRKYIDISPNKWKLPKNWYELVEAVEWASKGRIPLKIYAPLSVVAEFYRRNKELILHLVNFDVNNTIKNILVELKNPAKRRLKRISVLSPDYEGEEEIKNYFEDKDKILFKIPKLVIYTIVIVEFL